MSAPPQKGPNLITGPLTSRDEREASDALKEFLTNIKHTLDGKD